jgi:hypothetical protein
LIKRLIAAIIVAATLAIGFVGLSTSPADAQCVPAWYQINWVLNAHGSTQYLADTCNNNHFAAYDYPNGGGAPALAWETWVPFECIHGGVSIATGNNAGVPSNITFKGVANVTFCQFDVYGWGTNRSYKVGSCNGWNIRSEGWIGSTYGNVWYGGVSGYSPSYCSPSQPQAKVYNYGI